MKKRYQVFLSSTFRDLQEERTKAIYTLLELGCIPSGMELFPAANKDQWSYIQGLIDECDYFVVVLAGKYGSISPDTGQSYTQMEYEYALKKKKPIIRLLHKNPSLLPLELSEIDPHKANLLKNFRAELETKLCKHWTTAEGLGLAISGSLAQLFSTDPAPGWIRASEIGDEGSESQEQAEILIQLGVLQAMLEKQLNSSFLYCKSRKENPVPESNTAMYFYGLNFEKDSPVPVKTIAAQAIITEFTHLKNVTFGDEHNNNKFYNEQIADEIVDTFRYLFIFSMCIGLNNWEDVRWAEMFCESRLPSSPKKELVDYTTPMLKSHEKLLELNKMASPSKGKVTEWIENYVYNLGGVAFSCGIPLELISNDLKNRINEDQNDPDATVKHVTRDYIADGMYLTYKVQFMEKTGSYRSLLRLISEKGFNIVLSSSRTIVWDEIAEAILLLTIPRSKISSSINDIFKEIEISSNISTSQADRPNIYFWHSYNKNILQCDSEKSFLEDISVAMNQFNISLISGSFRDKPW